jgi:translation initiation factor IF-3
MARTKIRINGDLRGTPRVDVIGSSGDRLGVMPVAEALRLAIKEGLDLVEVNPGADPPVCKLLDFDKYKYEAGKAALRGREDTVDEDDPEGC